MRNKPSYIMDVMIFLFLFIACSSVVFTYVSFKLKGESKSDHILFTENDTIYQKIDLMQPYTFNKTLEMSSNEKYLEEAYLSQLGTEYFREILNFSYLDFPFEGNEETFYLKKIRQYFADEEVFQKYKTYFKMMNFAEKQVEYRLFVSSAPRSPFQIELEGSMQKSFNNTTTKQRVVKLKGVYMIRVFDALFEDKFKKINFDKTQTYEIEIIMQRTKQTETVGKQYYKIVDIIMEKINEST